MEVQNFISALTEWTRMDPEGHTGTEISFEKLRQIVESRAALSAAKNILSCICTLIYSFVFKLDLFGRLV